MVDHVSTKECDKQSVSYFGPKIWNFITQETKSLQLWQHSKNKD